MQRGLLSQAHKYTHFVWSPGGSDASPRLFRGHYGRNMVYTGPNHREESQDSKPVRPIHPPATPSIAKFAMRQFSHEMLCGFMAAANPAAGRLFDDGRRNLNSSRPHSTRIHVMAELARHTHAERGLFRFPMTSKNAVVLRILEAAPRNFGPSFLEPWSMRSCSGVTEL